MSQLPHQDEPSSPNGSQGMNQGMQVLSYVIAGIVVYGGLGWLGDHLLKIHLLLPIGIVAGAALGIYLVIKRFTADLELGARPTNATTKTTKGRV